MCLRMRSKYKLLGPRTVDSNQQIMFRSLGALVTDVMSKTLTQ